jgi:hypothetical protein
MVHVTCVPCGINGVLLADESPDIPRCLRCGRPFQVAEIRASRSRNEGRPTDDLIATWLSEGPVRPARAQACDFSCRYCGYAGPTPHKNGFGVIACPVCGEWDRPRRKLGRSRTVCPDCGLIFELSAHDQGKTVICPGCNYFLGCLIPVEKARIRRFWSRR